MTVRRATRLACLLGAACLTAACAPSGGGGDAGAIVLPDSDVVRCPAIDAVMDFIERRDRAECERAVQCSTDEGTYPAYECWPHGEGYRAGVCDELASGTRVFHADAVDACLEALDALVSSECRIPPGGPVSPLNQRARDACGDSVFEYTDDSRYPYGECSDGSDFCQPYGSRCIAGPECGGVCSPPIPAGGPCGGVFYNCTQGFHCDRERGLCVDSCDYDADCARFGDDTTPYCIDGRCQAGPQREGDPCATTAWSGQVCGAGLYCRYATNQCVRPAAPGGACAPEDGRDACQSPGYFECSRATSTCVNPTGRCSDYDDRIGCTAEAPFCGSDGFCTADPTCVRCSTSDGYDGCPIGYICTYESLLSYCIAAAPRGASCDATTHCDYGLTCAQNVCVPVVRPWESCGERSVCPRGFECDDGECVWTYDPHYSYSSPIGAPCDYPCSNGECIDGICQWRASGAACDAGARQCPRGCDPDTLRCREYEFVGIDEPCDDVRLCGEDAFCVRRAVRTDGVDDRVCRPTC